MCIVPFEYFRFRIIDSRADVHILQDHDLPIHGITSKNDGDENVDYSPDAVEEKERYLPLVFGIHALVSCSITLAKLRIINGNNMLLQNIDEYSWHNDQRGD